MATTETYDTVGAHTSTVPSGVQYAIIECWGAEGGAGEASGGLGGYIKAKQPVTGGETLNIHVGGAGGSPTAGSNGGGSGGMEGRDDVPSGGGGGGSDVRQGGDALGDRIVVGGGGGGGGSAESSDTSEAFPGGDGGYPEGQQGGFDSFYDMSGGPPGTQSSGGGNGSLGQGGSASDGFGVISGAGGGGYYGGGIGSGDGGYEQAPGGGGGSSTATGEVLSDTTGARTGDGKVVITYDTPPAAPSGLTATEDASENVDLSWTDNSGNEDEFRVYRTTVDSPAFPGDYTQIATVGANTTAYQDATVSEGSEYTYAVTAWNPFGESSETTAAITTSLEATTNLSLDATNGDQFDLSWTDNSDGEDGYRIYVSTDGGSTWSLDKSVAANSTTATTTNLLDGETYDIQVRPYTTDAEGSSPTVTGTTELPAASAPTLGNGVEDEVAVAIPDVIDNGLYRAQIRETGESSWDSNATGFAETTLAADADTSGTEDTQFTGREDGEEYEVRVRTESADAGSTAWTSPVSIVTKFPGSTNLSAAVSGRTTLDLSWTDNADNEDGQRVERREQLDASTWSAWQTITDVGANTTSYSDSGLSPGTTYEYRIEAYTDDTDAYSNVEQTTTDAARLQTTAIPAAGYRVEVDHSSGATHTPEPIGDPSWDPELNGRPEVTIPVARDDKWDAPGFERATVRVWKDGQRLPVDTLVKPIQRPGETVLVLRGGTELEERYQRDVESEEAHLLAEEFVTQTGYTANVADPNASTTPDTLLQDADSAGELSGNLASALASTDPWVVTGGGLLRPSQVAYHNEAEDFDDGSALNFSTSGVSNASQGGAIRLVAGDVTTNTTYTRTIEAGMPAGNVGLAYRLRADTASTGLCGFRLEVNGETAATFTSGWTMPDTDWSWFGPDTVTSGLSRGDTVTIELTALGGGQSGTNVYLDTFILADTRFSYTSGTVDAQGGLTAYELYPQNGVTREFADATQSQLITSATFDGAFSDTSGPQAVGLSNDSGSSWTTASNTDTVTADFSSSPTNEVRARVRLGAYGGTIGESPNIGAQAQALDLYTIEGTLDNTPLVLNQSFDGKLDALLTRVAENHDFVWELTWDDSADTMAVEWTSPGQRTADISPQLVDYETEQDYSSPTLKAVVRGGRQTRRRELFTSNHGTAVDLDQDRLIESTEAVYDTSTGQQFERGSDYTIDNLNGTITVLASGAMSDATQYAIDYQYKPTGEYEAAEYSGDPTTEVSVDIPEATTDQACGQAALRIVQQTSEPIRSATVDIGELPVGVSLVEAVNVVDLPDAADRLEIWSVEDRPGSTRLQLGSREPVSEVVSRIRADLGSVQRRT